MLLKPNAVNQIVKDTVIFQEQENVAHICIILKGCVTAKNNGSKIALTQGCILGIHDLYMGRYLSDYVASEDTMLYPFPVEQVETLGSVLKINKDYNGLMVASQCSYVLQINNVMEKLRECTDSLYTFVTENYRIYIEYAKQNSLSAAAISRITELEPYSTDFALNSKAVDYYTAAARIPLATVKEYYGHSIPMTLYQLEEASGIIARLTIECLEMTEYIKESFHLLMNHSDNCLFKNTIGLFAQAKNAGKDTKELMSCIDYMVDEINRMVLVFEQYTNSTLPVNRERMEELYAAAQSGTSVSDLTQGEEDMDDDQLLELMHDSLKQIIHYSTLDKEREAILTNALDYFIHAKDRLSTTEEMRECRKTITGIFYELYENVFLLSYQQNSLPKAVELFLNFGFLDEKLLTKEQLLSISKLKIEKEHDKCNIYTLREWLTLVYEGKKQPSKNEFDLDYKDVIREKRKNIHITEEEERQLLTDNKRKLQFEIENMFAYNNKIVNGLVSTFVPCLYKEIFFNWPDKEFLTNKKINDSFERVHAVDYSAFYRESLYMNEAERIEKEYIMKEVFPDIILLPMAGSKASMWQEISDKQKNNPGRFIFPIFLDTNLDDIMVRLFGQFRWELCRCLQGTFWNNLKHKSLTSEYVDYLQFYRKNHDLSEERKEKLKLQIQKGRNNSREVFVIDYEAWIKGEAKGAVKLNKVAREFLATYCPFSKELRTKLMLQPIFTEAFARFNRDSAKKLYELEARVRNLQKDKVNIPSEISDTLNFYREM